MAESTLQGSERQRRPLSFCCIATHEHARRVGGDLTDEASFSVGDSDGRYERGAFHPNVVSQRIRLATRRSFNRRRVPRYDLRESQDRPCRLARCEPVSRSARSSPNCCRFSETPGEAQRFIL